MVNGFWLRKNILYTPTEKSILNGITRRCILKLCKINKIKFKIGNFKLKDIYKAEHVFITGTAAEIQLVKNIRKKSFKDNSKMINFLKMEYEKIKKISPNLIKDLR